MALDLNQAQSEFQNLANADVRERGEHTALQETCYRTEAELTAARDALAELKLERSGRAAGWTAGQADRRHRRAARRRAKRKRRSSSKRQTQLRDRSWTRTSKPSRDWKRETESARERLPAKSRRARTLQQALRERAKATRSRPAARAATVGRGVDAEESARRRSTNTWRRSSAIRACPQGRADRVGRSGAPGRREERTVREAVRAADGARIDSPTAGAASKKI